jgi:hypothetical protein
MLFIVLHVGRLTRRMESQRLETVDSDATVIVRRAIQDTRTEDMMEQMRFEPPCEKNLNASVPLLFITSKYKMNTYLLFLMNGFETVSAATTAAALELNQTAFTAYTTASETLSKMNWHPIKELMDNHWGRLAQMNPIIYLYPLTILLWAYVIYASGKRNEQVKYDDFGEMKITIYTRGRPSREWRSISPSSSKYGHRMVRRSMNAKNFYELQ